MAIDPVGTGSSRIASALDETRGGDRFATQLAEMLRDVNRDQVEAAGKIEELVVQGKGSIHEAMVAMSKAEGSFRLAMQLRNRVVEAVNQLLQTQV